jgi:integrase
VLVFSTVEGGLLSSDNLSRDWGRVCWRFHALRHIHTSLLLAAGVPVLTVSRRLGHANVSTVVRVSPKAVQIVFGQVGETEVSFHTLLP